MNDNGKVPLDTIKCLVLTEIHCACCEERTELLHITLFKQISYSKVFLCMCVCMCVCACVCVCVCVCVGFVISGCFHSCVGVLVICVLVFSVFLYGFVYVYLFLFVTGVWTTATE